MGRLLELIAFAFLLWLAWEGVKARVRAFFAGPAPTRQGTRGASPAEILVRCAACGTHVPRARALAAASGGALYCSERCRDNALPVR